MGRDDVAGRGVIAELICDGYHVHPSSVRMAFKLFPGRICLISDSLRCCGMPDGKYELGGQDVFLSGGVARLEDGTIAGSATNVYQCMLNAIEYGIPVETAVAAATITPAREIGADDLIIWPHTATLKSNGSQQHASAEGPLRKSSEDESPSKA